MGRLGYAQTAQAAVLTFYHHLPNPKQINGLRKITSPIRLGKLDTATNTFFANFSTARRITYPMRLKSFVY